MIKFSTLFKTVAFATALNTENEHDALHHDRNRRLWNWAAEAIRNAEQHARWLKDQAHARRLKAQEHARRAAAEARRRAEQARAHARRVAAEARRKAEQHARWLKAKAAAEARKRAEQAKAHARRVAAAAKRKARQLAATARAFVNKIENQFGGFNGVLKAFRIVFSLWL